MQTFLHKVKGTELLTLLEGSQRPKSMRKEQQSAHKTPEGTGNPCAPSIINPSKNGKMKNTAVKYSDIKDYVNLETIT